jgi:ribosomal protein S19E (S16A)
MGDIILIGGLKEKRAAVAGRIVDLRREIDKLQADLVHIDAVLKIYGLEPAEIPNKGRMPVRSTYFGRNELSRRCRDELREKGSIRADDVAVRAMRDKGMDPENNRKTRSDFVRRILVSLHDLRKAGMVDKVGHGRGVRWTAKASPTE